jgi:hypothetical protein
MENLSIAPTRNDSSKFFFYTCSMRKDFITKASAPMLVASLIPSVILIPVLWGVPGGFALALSISFPVFVFLGLLSAAWNCVTETWHCKSTLHKRGTDEPLEGKKAAN